MIIDFDGKGTIRQERSNDLYKRCFDVLQNYFMDKAVMQYLVERFLNIQATGVSRGTVFEVTPDKINEFDYLLWGGVFTMVDHLFGICLSDR